MINDAELPFSSVTMSFTVPDGTMGSLDEDHN
jgi:hypothetical protein